MNPEEIQLVLTIRNKYVIEDLLGMDKTRYDRMIYKLYDMGIDAYDAFIAIKDTTDEQS